MTAQYPLGPVMLDVAGLTLTDEEREILAHPQVGGVIFFARNFADIAQLTDLVRDIRACRADILIAVDHEGGRVQRFRTDFTRIPSMFKLAQSAPSLVEPCARLMALELMAAGIDFTFAPVLDRYNPSSQVIGDRAFDNDVMRITEHAGRFIRGLQGEGMAAVGKHFPGHGGVDGDTHLESATDSREWDDIAQTDLVPFTELAPMLAGVMPAHVTFPAICDQPVGFSSHWLQQVLRQQLNFSGVVFSDDLAMAAAKVAGGPLERGLAALTAGCDMALLCNQPCDAITLVEGLESSAEYSAVQQGDNHLLALSARQRRSQLGFNWQALRKDSFWCETRMSIERVMDSD